CLLSRTAKVRTTNGCSADTPLNASCIAWGDRHIGTDLPSKEPHFSHSGQATLTGPQRIWTYLDAPHPPTSAKLKQLFGRSAKFAAKTVLYSTANRLRAQESKRMTSTMASPSSSTPIWPERGFRCRSTSGLAMRFTRNPNWLLFLFSCPWKHLSFVPIPERQASLRNFTQWSCSTSATAA